MGTATIIALGGALAVGLGGASGAALVGGAVVAIPVVWALTRAPWTERTLAAASPTSSVRAAPTPGETILFVLLLSGPPRLRARDAFASFRGELDWAVVLNVAVWTAGAVWVTTRGFRALAAGAARSVLRAPVIAGLMLATTLGVSAVLGTAPYLSSYRVAQIAVAIVFGALWVERYGVDSAVRHLLGGYVAVGAAILVAWVVAPDLVYVHSAIREGLRGDFIADTGAVAALGLILVVAYPVIRSGWGAVPLIALFGVLLSLSRTRSAYGVVAAVVALSFLKVVASRRITVVKGLVPVVATVALLAGVLPALLSWLTRGGAGLATLSDRVPLWGYTVRRVLAEAPVLGFGLDTSRRVTFEFNPLLGSAHSAYVEVLFGGGLLAAALLALVVVGVGRDAIALFLHRGGEPRVFAACSLLLAVLLIGVVSEQMVLASPTSFTFWLLLSLIPAMRIDRSADERPEPVMHTRAVAST